MNTLFLTRIFKSLLILLFISMISFQHLVSAAEIATRPKPPNPWNAKAIVGTLNWLSVEGEENTFALFFTLKNNTDLDYRISDKSQVEIIVKLKKEKNLTASEYNKDHLSLYIPIFIPANQERMFPVYIDFPYARELPREASREERDEFIDKKVKYFWEHISNLDGFILYDFASNYEIDLIF